MPKPPNQSPPAGQATSLDAGTGGGRVNYEALASTYARYRAASPRILAKLASYAERHAAAHLLDVGCGTADFTAALSALLAPTGGSVLGFDKSEAMLAEARAKHPDLQLRSGDAEQAWPFADESFDLVFTVNVIHYIRDLGRFFGEARRVLRPGGLVVNVTDSEEDIANRTMTFYFPETVQHELARYHPVRRLVEAMRGAGLEPQPTEHTRHESTMRQADVHRYRQRIFSALRIISDAEFERGLAKVEAAWLAGDPEQVELYSYVAGVKAAKGR
jgi:ubiquinone/menaquinone biosynthesis C-methylase UbiE